MLHRQLGWQGPGRGSGVDPRSLRAAPTDCEAFAPVTMPHIGYHRYSGCGMLSCGYKDTAWRKYSRAAMADENATCFMKAVLEVLPLEATESRGRYLAGWEDFATFVRRVYPDGFIRGWSVDAVIVLLDNFFFQWGYILPLRLYQAVPHVDPGGQVRIRVRVVNRDQGPEPLLADCDRSRGICWVPYDDKGRFKPHWLPVTQISLDRDFLFSGCDVSAIVDPPQVERGLAPPGHVLDNGPLDRAMNNVARAVPVETMTDIQFYQDKLRNLSCCVGVENLPMPWDGLIVSGRSFYFVGDKLFDSGDVSIVRGFPNACQRAWESNPGGVFGKRRGIAWQLHPKVIKEAWISEEHFVYVRIGKMEPAPGGGKELVIRATAGETLLVSGDYNPRFMGRLYTTNSAYRLDKYYDVVGLSDMVYRVFSLCLVNDTVKGRLKKAVPFTLEKVIDPSTLKYMPVELPKWDPSNGSKEIWLSMVFSLLQASAPERLTGVVCQLKHKALAEFSDGTLPDDFDPLEAFMMIVRTEEAIRGFTQVPGLATHFE